MYSVIPLARNGVTGFSIIKPDEVRQHVIQASYLNAEDKQSILEAYDSGLDRMVRIEAIVENSPIEHMYDGIDHLRSIGRKEFEQLWNCMSHLDAETLRQLKQNHLFHKVQDLVVIGGSYCRGFGNKFESVFYT